MGICSCHGRVLSPVDSDCGEREGDGCGEGYFGAVINKGYSFHISCHDEGCRRAGDAAEEGDGCAVGAVYVVVGEVTDDLLGAGTIINEQVDIVIVERDK